MQNNSPKVKGEKSEGMVLSALLRAGKVVLMPFGDNQRYDLVVDDAGVFTRVQCKTGRLRNGVMRFKTCSTHYHRGGGSKHYRDQADVFGVYCPELDAVYLVPVADVPTYDAYLRVERTKNNMQKGIRDAELYKLITPT